LLVELLPTTDFLRLGEDKRRLIAPVPQRGFVAQRVLTGW